MNTTKFLKYVWPIFNIMHKIVTSFFNLFFTKLQLDDCKGLSSICYSEAVCTNNGCWPVTMIMMKCQYQWIHESKTAWSVQIRSFYRSVLSHIWTEYGGIQSISLRIQSEYWKIRTRITQCKGTSSGNYSRLLYIKVNWAVAKIFWANCFFCWPRGQTPHRSESKVWKRS